MHAQENKGLFRLDVEKLEYHSDEDKVPRKLSNLSVNSEMFSTSWDGWET